MGSGRYCLERHSLVLFQTPNDRGFSWAIRGPALFLREEVGAPLDRDVTSVFRCSRPLLAAEWSVIGDASLAREKHAWCPGGPTLRTGAVAPRFREFTAEMCGTSDFRMA